MNAVEPARARDENVFESFRRQARARPDAVAVVDARGETTYRELDARAGAVARELLAIGLAPQAPVGVLMERRADLLAILLGVLAAGGAYVPFDPKDPPDRIRRMLASCGAGVVVCDPSLEPGLRAAFADAGDAPPRTLDPAAIPDPAPGRDPAPLPVAPGGARLAYLLFTSGSTGEPKAVEVEHRNVQALLDSARELLDFRPSDRVLAASTIAFDASITELFLPLVNGASLLMRERAILLDPRRLARDVRAFGVTIVQTGPSVWQVVLADVPDFPRVRVAITHGEAVTPELARRIAALADAAWNLYGPTETTVWATGARLRADDAPGLSAACAPIGVPLAHVRAVVVDDTGRPVPDGVEGELCLGGPGVARGYRANDALTRERFVELDGERVYRSGDVVVRDGAGVLHYFGRNDDQIKVRGVRVEPGEIEAAILRDARVAQAAATWFATPGGTRAVVAAVVLRPGAACRPQDLLEPLKRHLPSTTIPARFLFVPWLPTTASGKVDRKTLRAAAEQQAAEPPAAAPPATGAAHAHAHAPGTPSPGSGAHEPNYFERGLAQIWCRMLGVDAVAPDDHFFAIGGDSLTAVQMMVEIESRFDVVLPVHAAFEAPTLEALAARIEQARRRADDAFGASLVFPLVPEGDGPPVFFVEVDLALARPGKWTVPAPLYAITLWARKRGIVRARSLESLAATYVRELRRVRPRGPYRLAGYSLGGLVAFEMAQQLRDAGETVESLLLLDATPPVGVVGDASASAVPAPRRDRLARRILLHLGQLARGPGGRRWRPWLASMLLTHRLPQARGWLHFAAVDFHLRFPNAVTRRLFPDERWRAFRFAMQPVVDAYRARPYDGPAIAVFSHQTPMRDTWSAVLARGHQRFGVDVHHFGLFDEPVLGQWQAWLTEQLSPDVPLASAGTRRAAAEPTRREAAPRAA